MEQHLHLFEPRVGLNYSLNPQTVVRAGFGISAPCIECGSTSLEVANSPFLTAVTLNQPGFSSIDNPYPNGINQALGRSLKVMEPYSQFPQTFIGGSIVGQEPHQTYPYAMEWNLNLERSFGSSIAAIVSYSGNRGVHMRSQRRQPGSTPGSIRLAWRHTAYPGSQSSAGHCHADWQRGCRNGQLRPVPSALS